MDNGGPDGTGNAGSPGSGSPGSGDGSASSPDTGRDGSVTSGGANGAGGSADDAVRGNDAPGGSSGADSTGSALPSDTGTDSGTGERRGRGRPRGSRNRNPGDGSATEGAGLDNASAAGDAPRKVSADAKGEIPNVAANTRALIEDGYQFAYWAAAQITNIPQWNIKDVEAEQLAERTQALYQSLGKRKAKKVEGFVNSVLPGFSLIAAALIITIPRIKLTRAIANGKVRRVADSGTAERETGPDTDTDTPTSGAADSVRHNHNGDSPDVTGGRWTSITGQDIAEIGKRYVEPHQ